VFSLSPIKILVIVAVVLLLLGPDKLPEVAHKLGSSWRALKRIQERVEAEVREAIPDLPSSGDIARIARSPVNLLNTLADRVDAREEESQTKEPAAASVESPLAAEILDEPDPLIVPSPAVPTVMRHADGSLPPDPSLN
jgi:sec-independent protein translocase protein TatB